MQEQNVPIEEVAENFLYYALAIEKLDRPICKCHVSYYPRLQQKFVVSCDGYRLHAYPVDETVPDGFYDLAKRSLIPSSYPGAFSDWQKRIADLCLDGVEIHLQHTTENRVIFDCGAEVEREHYNCALALGQPVKCMGHGATQPVMLMLEDGAFAVIMPRLPGYGRKI